MPNRDPKTGRFIKSQISKTALPNRDPKTGRFLSTKKSTLPKVEEKMIDGVNVKIIHNPELNKMFTDTIELINKIFG